MMKNFICSLGSFRFWVTIPDLSTMETIFHQLQDMQLLVGQSGPQGLSHFGVPLEINHLFQRVLLEERLGYRWNLFPVIAEKLISDFFF